MQSGQKKDRKGTKKRNNPRNSFVPQDNSANNQFISHNSQVSQQPSSLMSPLNSKNNDQSPRIKRPSRQNQNQSSKKGKNQSNRGRNHQRMQVIHEQNLNIKMNTPRKPNTKKNTYQPNEQQSQDRKSSPKKDVHSYIIQQTQSQMLEDQSVPQQKKMKELNAGMQKLSQSILQLKSNYKQLQQEQVRHHVKIDEKSRENLPIKSRQKIKSSAIYEQKTPEEYERQYKEYLKNNNEQKMVRKKVLQQLAEKDKVKLQQFKRQRQQKKQAQRRQRMKEIRQRNKFQDKHKRNKQIDAQRKKAIQQFVKKYEGVQYIAFKKQKQDQQKKQQLLQQQKKFLYQRKEMFKPIDFQQIDQHQKWYFDKIQQLNKQRRELKNDELQKIQQQNAELPQFWRGNAHNIALQERLQKVRKRKQPKQKLKRIHQYRAYIRQHFVPRTHQNKSLPSHLRNQSSLAHHQIKRYRYYKGVSYGQIIQTRPIAKSYEQIKLMGIHNLELMKKLPKKRSNSSNMEAYELKLLQQSRNRGKKQKHFLPDEDKILKNRKIQLPNQVKSDELTMVMKRLKAHDEKLKHKQYALNSQPQVLNEYIDQRAINEEIIENIQRKLSLLAQL